MSALDHPDEEHAFTWFPCGCLGTKPGHPAGSHWECRHDDAPCGAVAQPCGEWFPIGSETADALGVPADTGAHCIRMRHGDDDHLGLLPSLRPHEPGEPGARWVRWHLEEPGNVD